MPPEVLINWFLVNNTPISSKFLHLFTGLSKSMVEFALAFLDHQGFMHKYKKRLKWWHFKKTILWKLNIEAFLDYQIQREDLPEEMLQELKNLKKNHALL